MTLNDEITSWLTDYMTSSATIYGFYLRGVVSIMPSLVAHTSRPPVVTVLDTPLDLNIYGKGGEGNWKSIELCLLLVKNKGISVVRTGASVLSIVLIVSSIAKPA